MSVQALRTHGIYTLRLVLIWSIPGAISVLQGWAVYRTLGLKASVWETSAVAFGAWWIWVLFTPIIEWLCARFDARQPRNIIIVHAPCSIIFGAAFLAWSATLTTLIIPDWPASYMRTLTNEILFVHLVVLVYWAVLGVYYARLYNSRYQREKVRAEELAHEKMELDLHLTKARLMALQTQLQPHFLFNTLNAVSALMSSDVKAARKMLANISDLLRDVLEFGETPLVPFKREVTWLQQFLALETIRFGDRMHVDFDIESGLDNLMIPPFILQPLAENAVNHGIEKSANASHIHVKASCNQDRLMVQITDDGPGLSDPFSFGVGLNNTKERLNTLFGADCDLTVRNREEGGCRVSLCLPRQQEVSRAVSEQLLVKKRG